MFGNFKDLIMHQGGVFGQGFSFEVLTKSVELIFCNHENMSFSGRNNSHGRRHSSEKEVL